MRVLITGAFGFVGSNLAAFLAARGFEVWALDLLRPPGRLRQGSGAHARLRQGSGAHDGRNDEGYCDEGLVAMESVKGEVLHSNSQPVSGCENGCENGCKNGGGAGVYSRCFTWEELGALPWGEVDAVVHLAGMAHDTKSTANERLYFEINTELTAKVLAAAASEGSAVGRFVLFSSVKAVADRVDGVLTEDAAPAPGTPYGRSKLAAEALLYCGHRVTAMESVKGESGHRVTAMESVKGESGHRAAFAKAPAPMVTALESVKGGEILPSHLQPVSGCEKGACEAFTLEFAASLWLRKHAYILRPCMIHGPGNRGNLNALYSVVRRGFPWPLGAYENRRSFASIENVCAVVEGLLTQDVAPGAYQVADDEPLATGRLIELMAEATGKKARIWRVPRALIRLTAGVGDLLRLPLNSERLRKLTESYVVSNRKIKQALGWESMPVGAEEGMRRTLAVIATRESPTPRLRRPRPPSPRLRRPRPSQSRV